MEAAAAVMAVTAEEARPTALAAAKAVGEGAAKGRVWGHTHINSEFVVCVKLQAQSVWLPHTLRHACTAAAQAAAGLSGRSARNARSPTWGN